MLNEWLYYDSNSKLKVTEIEYHRNGVYGNGFHVVNFIMKDGNKNHKMIAVIFDEPGSCAVLDQELLPNISFGVNSWRGDVFEKTLRNQIEESYNEHVIL